jgi:hypothetical protein
MVEKDGVYDNVGGVIEGCQKDIIGRVMKEKQ